MITKAATPGIPSTPEMAEVAKLIGTCIPIEFPNAFKKNKNSAPIMILMAVCPTNRNGFRGVPTMRTNKMSAPIIPITINGCKSAPSSACTIL